MTDNSIMEIEKPASDAITATQTKQLNKTNRIDTYQATNDTATQLNNLGQRPKPNARFPQTSSFSTSSLLVSNVTTFEHSSRFLYEPDTNSTVTVTEDAKQADRSPYLVQRLIETNERNLFNHVKFNLVKQEIDKLGIARPRLLDIGCGLKVAHTYLSTLDLDCDYFGTDYEPNFHPDAVVDLLNLGEKPTSLPWVPDVVLMLDVLEHLHEDVDELDKIVSNLSKLFSGNTTMIFTLPQMYRLDRFKLGHLHYPEHKIRLTQKEWCDLIGRHFTIQSVQGFGYLSVIPYLPMASKRYHNDNRLGKLFRYLRGTFFEWPPFKPVDLWLSRLFGKLPWVNTFSNDILLVVSPGR